MGSLRTSTLLAVVFAQLLGAANHASALLPADHRDLTRAECRRRGLPTDFCAAAASSAYSTDEREWDDLSAHAQTPDGVSLCDAAIASAEREQRLAAEMNGGLRRIADGDRRDRATEIAQLLGRALHTLHDECAHQGMSNAEHSWYSRGDYCTRTQESPDVQPEAMACARTVTREVFDRLVARLDALSIGPAHLDTLVCESPSSTEGGGPTSTPCTAQFLPGPFQACRFLGDAHDWDGIDRRWDDSVVAPALLDAFERGLFDDARAAVRVCDGDSIQLAPPESRDPVNVEGDPPSCLRLSLLCFGSADEAQSLFSGSAADAEDDPAPPAYHSHTIPASDAPACSASTSRGHSGAIGGAFVAAALLSLVRRQRRRRS